MEQEKRNQSRRQRDRRIADFPVEKLTCSSCGYWEPSVEHNGVFGVCSIDNCYYRYSVPCSKKI